MHHEFYPFADYWWFYASFIGGVLLLLVLDLVVFHKEAHEVSTKEALGWTVVWTGLALLFNLGLWWWLRRDLPTHTDLPSHPEYTELLEKLKDPALVAAKLADELSLQFLIGFLVEKSLSVDNLFVIVVIFSFFHIPAKYQHRTLFYGIIGAIVFRGLFIAIAGELMKFEWVVYLMGAFLIVTAIKMVRGGEQKIDPDKNIVVRLTRRIFPVSTELDGDHFFTIKNGVRYATPLFLALVFIEFTDIVFAIDSIPAIFGITKEPMIVFTSNMFAILGLRNLYFLLANAVDKFHLLKWGLAIVLAFVGAKMAILLPLHIKVPTLLSLAFILVTIGASIVLSLKFPKKPTHAA